MWEPSSFQGSVPGWPGLWWSFQLAGVLDYRIVFLLPFATPGPKTDVDALLDNLCLIGYVGAVFRHAASSDVLQVEQSKVHLAG